MKIRTLIMIILLMAVVSPTVSAHRVIIDYGIKSIYIEAYYGGGEPLRDGDVKIYTPDGRLYVEGKTDDEGKFSFDPGFEKEFDVVVESTGHRGEVTINMTAAAGGRSDKGGEMPLYLRVFAGFGYLLGILGIALWYKSFKKARE